VEIWSNLQNIKPHRFENDEHFQNSWSFVLDYKTGGKKYLRIACSVKAEEGIV